MLMAEKKTLLWWPPWINISSNWFCKLTIYIHSKALGTTSAYIYVKLRLLYERVGVWNVHYQAFVYYAGRKIKAIQFENKSVSL